MKLAKLGKSLQFKRFLPLLLLLGGVVIFMAIYFFILRRSGGITWNKLETSFQITTSSVVYPYASYVDGRGVSTIEEQIPDMVGVMIDNSPDVSSQAGLSEAKIVYEALAEGGITRYLAFFEKNQSVSEVGPVRSARMYYLNWLQEYGDAMYLHVGGSPEALSYLKRSTIFDINEFGWGKYFWRNSSLVAPHNTFTKSENWQAIFDKFGKKREKKSWEGWKFGDVSLDTNTSTQSAQVIHVPYFSSYKILWSYNVSSTIYERSINGRTDKDSAQVRVTANNVVVQFTSTKVVDEVGRRDVVTIGSGEVVVARKGIITRGTWKKDSTTARTKFFDVEGKEIILTPGKTWVQIVPVGTVLEITN